MGTRSNPQRLEEKAGELAEFRRLVARLEAENARLRAKVAALRGGEEPGGVEGDAVSREDAPPLRKAPPRWVKANVVVVERLDHAGRGSRCRGGGERCRTGRWSMRRATARPDTLARTRRG